MNERPDGSTATIIGWVLVVVGVLAAFFVGSAESAASLWLTIGIANLGIGLGVLLLSLGYLVRAIWYLPGREINVEASTVGKINQCGYCDLVIREPAMPCSAFPTAELIGMEGRIDDERCLRVLRDKGFLT